MATETKSLRICPKGHQYYKSSAGPVCPICEQEQKPEEGFLSLISAPARRALQHAGLSTPERLAEKTEAEVLKLHGIGPTAIPKLRRALEAKGLSFKNLDPKTIQQANQNE